MLCVTTKSGLRIKVRDTIVYKHFNQMRIDTVYGLSDKHVFIHGREKGEFRRIDLDRIIDVYDTDAIKKRKALFAGACSNGDIQINDAADELGIERGEMAAITFKEKRKQ